MLYGGGLKAAEAMRKWFEKESNTEWLLIFDNFDDLEAFDINDYFPRASWGSTLVTSRRRDVSGFWTGIEVPEMSMTGCSY